MRRPEPDPRLLRIAGEIADDRAVDWQEATASLDEPGLAAHMERLRTLEVLAAAYRSSGRGQGERPGSEQPVLFRWGDLAVHEPLGSGSFGQVYRATDTLLGRQVALKLRPPGPSASRHGGRQFIDEARRLARIRHPNVVAVHGAGEHDARVGFWTDLIDGRTLAEQVASEGPLGPAEAVAVGAAVCRALAAVHGAGLVHGDVKPSNVMRERGGRIVLIDFGAGSILNESAGPAFSAPTQGTPVVLAPELLAGDPASPASDLYAAGVLIYFLLTGSWPLQADSLEAAAEVHRNGKRVPLTDLRPDVPARLADVVEQALSPEPDRRHASAGAMESALRESLRDALPGSGVASSRPALPKILAVAAVALLVLVPAAWLAFRPASPIHESETVVPRLSGLEAVPIFSGDHAQPAFSPDGRMMAFISDRSGSPQVWIRSLAGGDPVQVTHGDAAAARPRWTSADEIVFARRGLGIWSVPALGGEPRQIVDSGRNPDTDRDGRLVVFEHDRHLWTVPIDGGTPRQVEIVARGFLDAVPAGPALSPDGTRVAYFAQEAGPTGDLWIAPLDGGEPWRLTHDRVEAGDAAWTPDGEFIVFASRRNGTRNLWMVPATGGAPVALTSGAGEDSSPVVTPDSGRLLFVNTRNRWILTALDPLTGQARELLERRVPIWLPQASSEGSRLAFFQADGPAHHLFTMAIDGSGLVQATRGEALWNIHPRWSRDARWLWYYEERPVPALRRVPAAGGESLLVAEGWRWLTEMHAVPSPEGRRVAYLKQDPDSGTTRILNLDNGRETTLPDPHLHGLEWSPDGQWVMGFTHARDIRLCPADGGDCRILTAGFRPRFAVDGESVYFHRPLADSGMWQVWNINVDGSDERPIAATGPHHPLDPTFDVTPEGLIVYTRYEAGRGELWTGRLQSTGDSD